MNSVDICIIGGGPGGMAAASAAARHGLTVALLDERPAPGGQIYHGLHRGPFREDPSLGSDYQAGLPILERFLAARTEAFFGARIWRIDLAGDEGAVSFSKDGKTQRLKFAKLILANGAIERPVPFEGWTLPGVMTVGAAQLLLKSSAVVPDGRVVLAGNGPLLLLFASQLIGLGVRILAILDTAPKVGRVKLALRHWRSLLGNREKLAKGLRMMRAIRSAGTPVFHHVSALSARGGERLAEVVFTSDGEKRVLDTDLLLVHEGIIPNTHVSRALNCRHVWDEGQQCFKPELDAFGQSSIGNVFIVGDGASIDGAVAAPASAEIAVGRILEQMGRADESSRDMSGRATQSFLRERRFRGFLESVYPPGLSASPCSDDTIVCRCEEVRAGSVRAALDDGAIGPAQAKVFARCGMGACQGRVCGPIVSRLIAEHTGRSIAEIGSYNIRFPLKPVTLAEMAAIAVAMEEGDEHAA